LEPESTIPTRAETTSNARANPEIQKEDPPSLDVSKLEMRETPGALAAQNDILRAVLTQLMD
jgi:hypothetical protein